MHWMAKVVPEKVTDRAQRTKIFDWKVPVRRGTTRASINGELFWRGSSAGPQVAAFVALGVLVALGGAAVVVARRRRGAGGAQRGRPGETGRLALALRPRRGARRARGRVGARELVDTSPQRGQTLPEQPRQIVLSFSETVEANFGAVQVFDVRARRVDDARTVHPGGSGSRLAVGLKPDLLDGTYVATYRVISADGHPVSGGLLFSIGAPGATAAPTVAALIGDSDAGPLAQAAFGVARGMTYLATALALGGLLFLLAVWLPALRAAAGASDDWREASVAFEWRLRRLLLGACALGFLAGVPASSCRARRPARRARGRRCRRGSSATCSVRASARSGRRGCSRSP